MAYKIQLLGWNTKLSSESLSQGTLSSTARCTNSDAYLLWVEALLSNLRSDNLGSLYRLGMKTSLGGSTRYSRLEELTGVIT